MLLPETATLTGGAVIFCSRPAGLSGWVTTPISSCSDFWSARSVGTPISPVPMKTMRTFSRLPNSRFKWEVTFPARRGLRHHLFARRYFALSHGRAALGAQIIENLFVRQNQQQPLADRRRHAAFFAIKTRRSEILK